MRVRYRRLSSRFDKAAYRDTRQTLTGKDTEPVIVAAGAVLAALEAPRQVQAEDCEVEDWEVEALLLKGTLKPSDLVDFGQGWQTVGEAVPFAEACERVARRASARRLKLSLLVGAVVLAAGAAGLALALMR